MSQVVLYVGRQRSKELLPYPVVRPNTLPMAHAVQEGLFLQMLFTDLYGVNVNRSILLHVDNQGAVALSKNGICQQTY